MQENNKISVFTIGVFDLFHLGHLNLLKEASKLGKLTVGLVTDAPVKKLKGETRPIIPFEERKQILQAINYVNDVMPLNNFEIPKEIILLYDLLVVGEDQQHIKNIDIIPPEKKVILPRTKNISTSKIEQKMKQSI